MAIVKRSSWYQDPEPLIIAERELIEYEGDYLLREDMFDPNDPQPLFSASAVGPVFFGWTPRHFGYRIRSGAFVDEDDVDWGTRRRSEKGHVRFTLPDIERMAYVAARKGEINGSCLITAIKIVRYVAQQNGYI